MRTRLRVFRVVLAVLVVTVGVGMGAKLAGLRPKILQVNLRCSTPQFHESGHLYVFRNSDETVGSGKHHGLMDLKIKR